ncbi:PREDICTED: cell cycle exit and neuronal differentiation protein 1 [Thamnophis sirtalis]|uniref:Cell cycle exit and neuronal differentiation protein 1 n=1 Tax=Thamnophis sirtalis TaxID=35019 RepID=A0A6I9Y160_9SAUR|nr:PREDICTED: cell cycle exit and neuronal differentiation protein 1 [Thamnophis sirtalis]
MSRMESKESTRSGNKTDTKSASSAKSEKPHSGPAASTDKKEAPKEQPTPAATTPAKKGATAPSEAAMLNDHSNLKPTAVPAAEGPEATANSEHKESSAEESPGSTVFENIKPLLIFGGAAVAAIAVIIGVAILARKK